MDIVKRMWKKYAATKKDSSSSSSSSSRVQKEGKNRRTKNRVTPEGYFSVYVGKERERFVIKTEFVNHPLFKALLEDAEMEYGYNSEGPIVLPCDVDLFINVLSNIENTEDDDDDDDDDDREDDFSFMACRFPFGTPSPSRVSNGGEMGKGYGAFNLLSPSRI